MKLNMEINSDIINDTSVLYQVPSLYWVFITHKQNEKLSTILGVSGRS